MVALGPNAALNMNRENVGKVELGKEDLPKSPKTPWVIASCVADCNLGLQPPESRPMSRDVLRSLHRNCASYEITACLRPCRWVFACADVAGHAF